MKKTILIIGLGLLSVMAIAQKKEQQKPKAVIDTSAKVQFTQKELDGIFNDNITIQQVFHKISIDALLRDKIDTIINKDQNLFIRKYRELLPKVDTIKKGDKKNAESKKAQSKD